MLLQTQQISPAKQIRIQDLPKFDWSLNGSTLRYVRTGIPRSTPPYQPTKQNKQPN